MAKRRFQSFPVFRTLVFPVSSINHPKKADHVSQICFFRQGLKGSINCRARLADLWKTGSRCSTQSTMVMVHGFAVEYLVTGAIQQREASKTLFEVVHSGTVNPMLHAVEHNSSHTTTNNVGPKTQRVAEDLGKPPSAPARRKKK